MEFKLEERIKTVQAAREHVSDDSYVSGGYQCK